MLRRAFSYVLHGKVHVPAESAVKGYVKPMTSYTPAQTVEFDAVGETLLYSVNAFRQASVLFPLPWSLGTYIGVPASLWGWWAGVLGPYSLLMVVPAYVAVIPHLTYLHSLRKLVHKVWYVRGGRLKIETKDLTGVLCHSYIELGNVSVKGATAANALTNSGRLTRDLKLNLADWADFNEAETNSTLTLSGKGVVHNPELLQAIIQGYELNVEDFEMNFDPENSMVSSKSIGGSQRA
jgi:hypothetical protein